MRGLDAEGQELLGLAIDPGDREPDDPRPDDGGRDPCSVRETGKDESMRRPRIGRRDDPRCQRQARPGRGIDVGEDRRRPAHGPRPCRVRGRGCERIPPAAVVPDLNQPRHQHAPDERRDPGRHAPPRPPARRRTRARHSARRRTARGAAPARTVPPRSPIVRARPRGVSSGTSRWAPASQVRAHVRGTTRYAS